MGETETRTGEATETQLSREEIIGELKKRNSGYQFKEDIKINFVVSRKVSDGVTDSRTYQLGMFNEQRPNLRPMVFYHIDNCEQVLHAERLRRDLVELGVEPIIIHRRESKIRRIRNYGIELIRAADVLDKIGENKV